jgi:RNA polymerase sigma-70 factor (ECF subfamily)
VKPISKTHSDKSIILEIQAGGIHAERASTHLFRQYAYFVRKRPAKYALNEEDALDAFSDAYLAVVDHIKSGRFRGESSIKTYLSRIFRNKCVDKARKNATMKVDWVEEFPDLPDESKDFLRKMISHEELKGVRQKLSQLSENCSKMLLMSAQGYSPEEIAQAFNLASARSASSQRYKCLEKLKKLMK